MMTVILCTALPLFIGGVVIYSAMYGSIQGMKETIDSLYGQITELRAELEKEQEEHYLTKEN